MKKIVHHMILAAVALFALACQNQDANKTQTNQTATTPNVNSKTASEKTSVSRGLAPSAPCGFLEASLQMKAGEYKALDETSYYCQQVKPLVNSSGFDYRARGNSSEVNELYLALNLSTRNNETQNGDLHKLLALAAAEVLDEATGQQLPEEVSTAILSNETRDFILPADGAGADKPRVKTVSVEHIERNETQQKASGFKYVKHVTMKF